MSAGQFFSIKEKPTIGKIIPRFLASSAQEVTSKYQFSVYCQNLLAGYWTDLDRYGWVEEPKSENYVWSGRVKKFMRDFTMHKSDVLCLQEVEVAMFESDILNPMKLLGYDGVVQKKIGNFPVGVGCLYKQDKFELLNVFERSSVIILELKLKETDCIVFVCSCHLMGDPLQPQVRINQLRSFFKHLKNYQKGKEHPTILCGDFNAEPNTSTYNLVVDGFLKAKSKENDVVTTDSDVKHNFKLKSAYFEVYGREPSLTLRTRNNSLVTDYIFYSSPLMSVDKVMQVYEPEDHANIIKTSLPNAKYGSDHLALQGLFTINHTEDE